MDMFDAHDVASVFFGRRRVARWTVVLLVVSVAVFGLTPTAKEIWSQGYAKVQAAYADLIGTPMARACERERLAAVTSPTTSIVSPFACMVPGSVAVPATTTRTP